MVAEINAPASIEQAVTDLQQHKDQWLNLTISQRIRYLEGIVTRTGQAAERWASAAIKAKGLAGSSLAGEEWISGPWAFVYGVQRMIATLKAFEKGRPRRPLGVRARPDGQVIARVWPGTIWDKLLFSGFRGEVWMEPGVTLQNLEQHMGMMYRQKPTEGKVALVLGAGNINAIAPLDVLYKLFAEGQVVVLKMNPVNEYVGPFIEEIFSELVQDGYLRVVYGGPEVGQALVDHDGVDEIHITGSARTHDAIVYGAGPEGEARKARREPRMNKRITSELGAVCPVIVLPGEWSKADIQYQAQLIATMKMHNGGFNCVAAQVMIVPEKWAQADELIAEVRAVLKQTYPRPAYYPGSAQRQQHAASAHPQAEILDKRDVPTTLIPSVDASNTGDVCFRDEAFGGVLSVTRLPGDTPEQFLTNAVNFANDTLWGTLGANLIVHPRTRKALGSKLEDAIASLRYGAIAVNTWTGANFLGAECSWGAYPGHTLEDIQSGIGVVHNALLFEKPQKSVIHAPFYPYPRNLLHGEIHMSPKPAWFITNRKQHVIGRLFTYFTARPSVGKLPAIFAAALRG
jgi:aldehyde dehydrogenase (NAD(P)+)